MSALGWNWSSGWSRRSLQGQGLRAAPPQVRFEPNLTDAAQRTNVSSRLEYLFPTKHAP